VIWLGGVARAQVLSAAVWPAGGARVRPARPDRGRPARPGRQDHDLPPVGQRDPADRRPAVRHGRAVGSPRGTGSLRGDLRANAELVVRTLADPPGSRPGPACWGSAWSSASTAGAPAVGSALHRWT